MVKAFNIPEELLALGYPVDLPPLPAEPEVLTDPGLPGEWGDAALWARTDGLQFLLERNGREIWGCGVGRDVASGGPSIIFLSESEKPKDLPEIVVSGRRKFRVSVLHLARRVDFTQLRRGALLRNTFAHDTGGLTGSLVSDDAATVDEAGGTLTGTFPSLSGSGQRGLTCAHVALGIGTDELLRNLPGSIAWLFRSPSGRRIVTAQRVGQTVYELFRVDTPWPILTYLPIGLPLLTFVYSDVAAGPVQPRAVPNPPPLPPAPAPPAPPPLRTTTFGARLRTGTIPLPGDAVYKIGRSTGLTWGTTLIGGLVVVLPVPFLPLFVILNISLYTLPIVAGDSGSNPIIEADQRSTGVAGLALGTSVAGVNPITVATALPIVNLFANVRL